MDNKTRRGFMCRIDFEHDGIVEVEVRLVRVVEEGTGP